MKRKITVRMDKTLFDKLQAEYQRFGYRSLSSYICNLLQERKLVEIVGGHELATAIHQVKTLTTNDLRVRERGKELCQSFDSLMTEIEELRSYVQSYITQCEAEQ